MSGDTGPELARALARDLEEVWGQEPGQALELEAAALIARGWERGGPAAGVAVEPSAITVAELTAIKTALTDRAHLCRVRAQSTYSSTADQRVYAAHADQLEDIAARLSFAVPGEPIQVVDQ